jgi:hypothetical protein
MGRANLSPEQGNYDGLVPYRDGHVSEALVNSETGLSVILALTFSTANYFPESEWRSRRFLGFSS